MKYKHKGYRESEKRDQRDREKSHTPKSPEQRQLRHMMDRSARLVIRCHQCSADAGPVDEVGISTTCSNCGAAVHVCRNCSQFDTGARWECREPINEPVKNKTAANDCSFFKPNTVLDATGRRSGTSPSSDARAAFENLFKKK